MLYLCFFIEAGTRRVHVVGTTAQLLRAWVTQQARQLLWNLADEGQHFTHLIRDNDGKYSWGFDAVFQSEGSSSRPHSVSSAVGQCVC